MKPKIIFRCWVLLSLLVSFDKSYAQEMLTLENAISIALERNYDIKLVANNLKIDENNVNLANAGILPVVTGNLTTSGSLQNSKQVQSTGEIRERNNAKGSNLNYGVSLNWTVFDGFGMFARYNQLQELQKLGEANLQLTILTKVGDVIGTYYDLVQQQQQLRAYDTAIAISQLRVQVAQNKFEIGRAARLEVLNAQVDFNTDTTNLLRQQALYVNTQILLNELLARDINLRFRVVDSIRIDDKLTLAQLSEQVTRLNPSLQASIINRRVAELEYKQVKANRYPKISVNTGYNFTRSESALGFATLTTGRGLNYGLTASVPIFNGFLQRRSEKNASILVNNSQLEYEKLNQNLSVQLATAYQNYLTSLTLVKLEESNQKLAKRNLDITLEKFRLGSIPAIEFRDAQLNYVNATFRFSTAQYEAKIAEVTLKEIAGALNVTN